MGLSIVNALKPYNDTVKISCNENILNQVNTQEMSVTSLLDTYGQPTKNKTLITRTF